MKEIEWVEGLAPLRMDPIYLLILPYLIYIGNAKQNCWLMIEILKL